MKKNIYEDDDVESLTLKQRFAYAYGQSKLDKRQETYAFSTVLVENSADTNISESILQADRYPTIPTFFQD